MAFGKLCVDIVLRPILRFRLVSPFNNYLLSMMVLLRRNNGFLSLDWKDSTFLSLIESPKSLPLAYLTIGDKPFLGEPLADRFVLLSSLVLFTI